MSRPPPTIPPIPTSVAPNTPIRRRLSSAVTPTRITGERDSSQRPHALLGQLIEHAVPGAARPRRQRLEARQHDLRRAVGRVAFAELAERRARLVPLTGAIGGQRLPVRGQLLGREP